MHLCSPAKGSESHLPTSLCCCDHCVKWIPWTPRHPPHAGCLGPGPSSFPPQLPPGASEESQMQKDGYRNIQGPTEYLAPSLGS